MLARGRRRAREQRPGTLIYRRQEIPCSMGTLDFFEKLHESGGGFLAYKSVHVTLLRADIPTYDVTGTALNIVFKAGETCILRDDDSGDAVALTIGENNSTQAAVITLNLQTIPA